MQVAERKVDFGFTFVPFPSSEVEHLRIGAGALTSYARRGAFAGRDAEGVPYVVPAFALADNPLTLKTRDGWNRQLARVTPLRASSLTMALGVVHEGLAAIYIPQFLAAALNARLREPEQLVQLEMSAARRVKETTRRELFLVKRRADDETLTMRRATREVRAVLRVHR